MKQKIFFQKLVIAAVCLCAVLGTFGSAADCRNELYTPKVGTYGGELRLPMGADPDVLTSLISVTLYGAQIGDILFDYLIKKDPNTLEYIPNIAKNWEVSNDGKTWTFHLRNDVHYTDKKKLSAYDVEFTMNDVIYNEKNHSQLMYLMQVNDKPFVTKAVDSFTVQFSLSAPFAPFLETMLLPIMPKHKYGKIAKEGKLEDYLHAGKPLDNFVTNGPFILDKVELGQRVVLKRNPNYWRKDASGNRLPYLDKITFVIIPDAGNTLLRFQNGELDEYALRSGEEFAMLKPKEAEKKFTLNKMGPNWADAFILINENNQKDEKGEFFLEEKKQQWFRDKNFRKACAYAINYQDIINIVYNGLAELSTGVWGAHRGYYHNANALRYDYDPQKAKSLLAQSGFKDKNGDGIVEDKNGNTVEFDIVTVAGDKLTKNTFEMICEDFKKIGLKPHLQLLEFNIIIDKITANFQWDMIGISFGGNSTEPHFNKAFFESQSYQYAVNPPRADKNGKPILKVDQPWEKRCNEIFALGAKEMDKTKRKALYDEWQSIFMDECPWLLLPLSETVVATTNKFDNVKKTKSASVAGSMLYNYGEIFQKPAY